MPFEIPENWVWTTIEDIAESNIGLTYKPTDICANGVPVYRSNNIQNRRICLKELVRVNTNILEKQYLQEGDLLICARNGSRNLVGKCAIVDNLNEPTSFGAFMAVCRSALNPWIFQILNSEYFNTYLDDSNSTAINQVTQKMLLAFQLPIPPAAEQERIISKLKQWYEYIDEIEDRKIELESYIKQTKSKILDLAISGKLVSQDPNDEPAIELLKRINPAFQPCDNSHYGNLPQGWLKLRLGDVCSFERGITFPSSAKCTIKQPGMIACIRTANVQDNLELDDLWYVGNEYIKGNTEKLVRKNDIIMSSANSRELVGKVSYVHDLTEQMTFGGFVLNIRANECILPFFLFLMLRTLYLKGYYLTVATQTTNIANLNTKILGDIEVLLPPLTEQERIINSVTNILASIENITAELS